MLVGNSSFYPKAYLCFVFKVFNQAAGSNKQFPTFSDQQS